MVVTDLAVISFKDANAILLETAPGVSVQDVLASTEAQLTIAPNVTTMAL